MLAAAYSKALNHELGSARCHGCCQQQQDRVMPLDTPAFTPKIHVPDSQQGITSNLCTQGGSSAELVERQVQQGLVQDLQRRADLHDIAEAGVLEGGPAAGLAGDPGVLWGEVRLQATSNSQEPMGVQMVKASAFGTLKLTRQAQQSAQRRCNSVPSLLAAQWRWEISLLLQPLSSNGTG